MQKATVSLAPRKEDRLTQRAAHFLSVQLDNPFGLIPKAPAKKLQTDWEASGESLTPIHRNTKLPPPPQPHPHLRMAPTAFQLTKWHSIHCARPLCLATAFQAHFSYSDSGIICIINTNGIVYG